MTITAIHKPAGVNIETNEISASTIGGITSHNVGVNHSIEREYSDGLALPTRNTIVGREDSVEFESLNVDDMLDLVGTIGQCVKYDAVLPGFEFYLRKNDKCSITGAAGAVHTKYVIKEGLLIPLNLNVQHGGNAVMSARCEAEADTNGAGIIVSHTNTLASIADNKRRYTLGPMTLNGTSIDNMKSLQIAFGVNVEREAADSSILPEYSNISEVGTVITVTGVNPAVLQAANIPIEGKALTHAATSFYLRRRGDSAGIDFEPNGDADHIKFTTAGLVVVNTPSQGDGRSATESTLQIYCEYDGTNNPLVVTTGSTIT